MYTKKIQGKLLRKSNISTITYLCSTPFPNPGGKGYPMTQFQNKGGGLVQGTINNYNFFDLGYLKRMMAIELTKKGVDP